MGTSEAEGLDREKASTDETPRPDAASLRVEYQTCLADVSQLDSDIWRSGTLFLGLSFVGLTVLLQGQAKDASELFPLGLVTALGLLSLFFYRQLVLGFLLLIDVNLFRMRQIERDLGMIKERYMQEVMGGGPHNENEDFAELAQFLASGRKRRPPSVSSTLVRLLWFLVAGWVVLLVKQAVYLWLGL